MKNKEILQELVKIQKGFEYEAKEWLVASQRADKKDKKLCLGVSRGLEAASEVLNEHIIAMTIRSNPS